MFAVSLHDLQTPILQYALVTSSPKGNDRSPESNVPRSNLISNQRPKIELAQAFMPVLVTTNFDDDSMKTEWASMETPFSHKSMGNFLHFKAANSVVSGPNWP